MGYAIIRNEKLTRAESYGAYVHNDRKANKKGRKRNGMGFRKIVLLI